MRDLNDDPPTTTGTDGLFGRNKLLSKLAQSSIPHREFAHQAEGKTVDASRIRRHSLSEAAKSLLIELSFSGKPNEFILAVVCGDELVDLLRVAAYMGARKARLASKRYVSQVTGCPIGAVVPFSPRREIKVMADCRLFDQKRLIFNSGVLNRSLEIKPQHYFELALPIIKRIGGHASEKQHVKGGQK